MNHSKISDTILARIKEQQRQQTSDADHALAPAKPAITYYSNDNISEFIKDGELEQLVDEVAEKIQELFKSLVVDVDNDPNCKESAQRVAKMYIHEVFQGRYTPQPSVTTFPNSKGTKGLQVIGPMQIRSACSHHLCPVIGKLWLGLWIEPEDSLLGLSKFLRIAQWVLARPQIQEDAIVMLADIFCATLKSNNLAIVIQTQHFCKHWRGVQDEHSLMTNTEYRGKFVEDAQLHQEFLSFIH